MYCSYSFALKFIFLQTRATSHSFYSSPPLPQHLPTSCRHQGRNYVREMREVTGMIYSYVRIGIRPGIGIKEYFYTVNMDEQGWRDKGWIKGINERNEEQVRGKKNEGRVWDSEEEGKSMCGHGWDNEIRGQGREVKGWSTVEWGIWYERRWIIGASMGQWEGYEEWEKERMEQKKGMKRQGWWEWDEGDGWGEGKECKTCKLEGKERVSSSRSGRGLSSKVAEVAWSSLVALFFYARAGQSVIVNCSKMLDYCRFMGPPK